MQDQSRLGTLRHLGRRFLEVLVARPLTETEAARIRHWLGPEMEASFFDQSPKDQRHGYEAALVVLDRGVTDREALRAALLHDVGKRHAHLGIVGRTVASLLIKLRLPLNRRMAIYRDHGAVAAAELRELGAPRLVVDFALHHHGDRPPTIDQDTWAVLQAADQPANTRSVARSAVTSS